MATPKEQHDAGTNEGMSAPATGRTTPADAMPTGRAPASNEQAIREPGSHEPRRDQPTSHERRPSIGDPPRG